MYNIESIRIRKSRRSYTGDLIDESKLEALLSLIERVNRENGLAIELVEDGSRAFDGFMKSYGLLRGVRTVIVLKGPRADNHLKEKLGYWGEAIVLEATNLGLGTCWVGGTYDRRSGVFKVGEGETLECVITVGNVEKESIRERLIHAMTHRKSKDMNDMISSDVEIPQWMIDGLDAVKRAPSAVNRQPVSFTYANGELRASVRNSHGFELIDLGIAKLHFEIGAGGIFELGNGGLFKKHNEFLEVEWCKC